MATQDEMVIKTIQQLIKEVKVEMQTKKVLSEGKTAQQVFDTREKDLKAYLKENVLKAIRESMNK